MAKTLTELVKESLQEFNTKNGKTFDFGQSWYNVSNDFNDYVTNYLFPKLNESEIVVKPLGNRFEFLAQEVENFGALTEEYVILDSVPVNLDLNKERTLLLNTNYPKIANKVYGCGKNKKMKFTIDDSFLRRNFNTLKDAIDFALAVYSKKISDINVIEENEIKSILLYYAKNYTSLKKTVLSVEDLINQTYISLLNIQNNSSLYNECNSIIDIPYTTQSKLDDILIITSDELKYKILDTKIANTFDSKGLDITKHIISFDTFNNMFITKKDIKVTQDIKTFLNNLGDYQVELNDTILKNTIFFIQSEKLQKEFLKLSTDFSQIEINDNFVYILDINKIKYKRNTKDMLKKFYNAEFNETNFFIHYYTKKTISPFYNNIFISL